MLCETDLFLFVSFVKISLLQEFVHKTLLTTSAWKKYINLQQS